MIEYLTYAETAYLAAIVRGNYAPDVWDDSKRAELAVKLIRLGTWALKEDAARERLRTL